VRLGEDHNWWVDEVSDPVHWDVDGLSIIDPRQVDHIIELIDPLREYGFDSDLFERAFIPFRITKDLRQGKVRLARTKQPLRRVRGEALRPARRDRRGERTLRRFPRQSPACA